MHKKQNGNTYDKQHDTGGIGWRIWQCAALLIRLAMACNQQWRTATWHINRERFGLSGHWLCWRNSPTFFRHERTASAAGLCGFLRWTNNAQHTGKRNLGDGSCQSIVIGCRIFGRQYSVWLRGATLRNMVGKQSLNGRVICSSKIGYHIFYVSSG